MLFLILTILSSVATSAMLKYNEGRGGNRLVVAGMNYLVAATLSFVMLDTSKLDIPPVWMGISIAAGIGFVGGFLMMMRGMKEIGLAIPSSTARLSMLIPVVGSIIFFDERPGTPQIAGLVAGVLAFVLLGAAQRSKGEQGGLDLGAIGILLAIFAIVGATDFSMKMAQEAGIDKDANAFYIFATAALFCWSVVALRQLPVRAGDLLTGAILGVPNYFSVYFLLLALRQLDASIVFPTVSAGSVVLVTLVAVLFWKEHPNAIAWAGILLAAVAVALLGL